MRSIFSLARGTAILVSALLIAAPLSAQTYPSKPVKLVVPYAPGGSVDLAARILAEQLPGSLGQPVVVENKPGASGAIGVDAVVHSPPDGHTLLIVGSGAITVNVHLTKIAYDPQKDLVPITMVATLPMVIAVNASLPVKNVRELMDYVKAKPGGMNYSSNGFGSVAFLSSQLFKRMTGLNMTHITYRGSAPAAAAIASGEVPFGFVDSSAAMAQARSGQVRVLAVTDPKRSAIVPDIPTIAESGVPGFAVTAWLGMFAPAGTPQPIIARINAEVAKALAKPEVRERILHADLEPAPDSPAAFASYVKNELETFGTVIKEAGIKAE